MLLLDIINSLKKSVYESDKLNISNTILVCGAGVSKSSKLPLGKELVEKIYEDFDLREISKFYNDYIEKVANNLFETNCNNYYSLPRLEVLFSGIRQSLSGTEYQNYIFHTLLRDVDNELKYENKTSYTITPNYHHYFLADYIRNGGICITFNFDELIECAYRAKYDESPQVISFPSDKEIDNVDGGLLIKAHGTFDCSNNTNHGIGIDTNSLHINGFAALDNKLLYKLMFNVSNIVAIGYSFSDSIDFIPFLLKFYDGQKINFYQYNYIGSYSGELNIRSFSLANGCHSDYFQFDYLLKPIINTVYFIDYGLDNLERQMVCSDSSCYNPSYTIDFNLLAKVKEKKEMIKVRILKTLGLLNVYGETELDLLMQDNQDCNDQIKDLVYYSRNIKGDYWFNFVSDVRDFSHEMTIQNYIKVFGSLNEFIFLKFKSRIVPIVLIWFPLTFIMWVGLHIINLFYHKRDVCLVKIKRHLYLFPYRILVRVKLKKASTIVLRKILQVRDLSIEVNDLTDYRYIRKEQIKMQYNVVGFNDKIEEQIKELLRINMDTNYFIEVTNLTRLLWEYTQTEETESLALYMSDLTKDDLSKKKIRKKASKN